MARTARNSGIARPALGRAALAILCAAALSACTQGVRNHGWAPSDEDLAEIVVGVDTRETVADSVGTPSSAGVLRDTGFYYVSQQVSEFGFREPEILSREVVAITFDDSGIVRNVERFGLEDGNVVALSRRVTDTSVQGIGFLRQLATNLGRIAPGGIGGDTP